MKFAIECMYPGWLVPRKHKSGRKVLTFDDAGVAESFALRQRDRWPGLKTKVVVVKK